MTQNLFDGVETLFWTSGVLIDLDFATPVREFEKLGGNSAGFDYRLAIQDPVFRSFETGGTSPAQFRKRIREILGNKKVTDEEIDAAWCSMMDTIPEEKILLLKELGQHYRLFLFSNTNPIHIAFSGTGFRNKKAILSNRYSKKLLLPYHQGSEAASFKL